jgi:hypothetical protein
VDFTGWSLEHIASYLKKHQSRGVCGRFRSSQLGIEVPYSNDQWVQRVAQSGLPLFQRTVLIALLAFGILITGCHTEDRQQSKGETEQHIQGAIALPQDTQDGLLGKVKVDSDTGVHQQATRQSKTGKHANHRRAEKPDNAIMGEAVIETTMGIPVVYDERPQPVNLDTARKH